jgi:hypothetical protein
VGVWACYLDLRLPDAFIVLVIVLVSAGEEKQSTTTSTSTITSTIGSKKAASGYLSVLGPRSE